MQETASTDSIRNTFFSKEVPISDEQLNAIFNDAVYGLNNINNYGKWGALNPFYEPRIDTWSALSPLVNDYNKQLIFEMQLKTYFNFTD